MGGHFGVVCLEDDGEVFVLEMAWGSVCLKDDCNGVVLCVYYLQCKTFTLLAVIVIVAQRSVYSF